MFCKFGSLELSRPVAATDLIERRVHAPGRGYHCGKASIYVLFSLHIGDTR